MSCDHDYFYYPATNEDGWKCSSCGHKPGEPEGFSPKLDRKQTFNKVHGLCSELHEADLIYFSNSDHGMGIADVVASRCLTEGKFDQYSIIQWVFECEKSHGDYWKKISEGVLENNDERRRCPCGLLSSSAQNVGGKYTEWTYRCSKHSHELIPPLSQLTFEQENHE